MNAMKENNIESLKDVVLCFFFPFALFWGGIVVVSFIPFPFEFLMPLGLFPFYIYSYFAANVSVRPVYRNMMIAQHFVGMISLVAFILLFLLGLLPLVGFVRSINTSALLNLPFLVLVSIFGAISVGGNMRWGSWDEAWPGSDSDGK